MRHNIIMVASGRFLDSAAFLTFARQHSEEFGIVDDSVSAFHVNNLIDAYRDAGHNERLIVDIAGADEAKELAESVAINLKKDNPNHYPNSPYPVPHLKLVE